MATIHLRVITPKKTVREEDVDSVTLPASEGEITVLPRHTFFFSRLVEGIIKIKKDNNEDFLAIGGGYVETDGKNLSVLVSRAYGQDEIDEDLTKKALEDAQKVIKETKEEPVREEAAAILRRSVIDMKLIKKRKRSS